MNTNESDRRCSECKSWMVKEYAGYGLGSQYAYSWWCGCGHREDGETDWAKTQKERLREHWERMNDLEMVTKGDWDIRRVNHERD